MVRSARSGRSFLPLGRVTSFEAATLCNCEGTGRHELLKAMVANIVNNDSGSAVGNSANICSSYLDWVLWSSSSWCKNGSDMNKSLP